MKRFLFLAVIAAFILHGCSTEPISEPTEETVSENQDELLTRHGAFLGFIEAGEILVSPNVSNNELSLGRKYTFTYDLPGANNPSRSISIVTKNGNIVKEVNSYVAEHSFEFPGTYVVTGGYHLPSGSDYYTAVAQREFHIEGSMEAEVEILPWSSESPKIAGIEHVFRMTTNYSQTSMIGYTLTVTKGTEIIEDCFSNNLPSYLVSGPVFFTATFPESGTYTITLAIDKSDLTKSITVSVINPTLEISTPLNTIFSGDRETFTATTNYPDVNGFDWRITKGQTEIQPVSTTDNSATVIFPENGSYNITATIAGTTFSKTINVSVENRDYIRIVQGSHVWAGAEYTIITLANSNLLKVQRISDQIDIPVVSQGGNTAKVVFPTSGTYKLSLGTINKIINVYDLITIKKTPSGSTYTGTNYQFSSVTHPQYNSNTDVVALSNLRMWRIKNSSGQIIHSAVNNMNFTFPSTGTYTVILENGPVITSMDIVVQNRFGTIITDPIIPVKP